MHQERNELVIVKSNRIIEARYKLNVREQKFILYVASLVKPDDKKFRYQKVRIKDIEKVLNTKNTKWGSIYKDIEEIIFSLNTKPLKIIKDNGDKLIINWVASANITPDSGMVTFEFSDELRPYLLQLKSHFTKYKFKNILHLKSGYSIRLYEILKSHQFKGKVTYELDALKIILGLEDKYPEYKAFKRSVLKRAQSELKKKSDIKFELEELREGRKVRFLTFFIYANAEAKVVKAGEMEELPFGGIEPMVEKLMQYGIGQKVAEDIYDLEFTNVVDIDRRIPLKNQYGDFDTYLLEKMQLVDIESKSGQVKNQAGYLLKAIKENYVNDKLLEKLKSSQKTKRAKVLKALKTEKLREYEVLSQELNEKRQQKLEALMSMHSDLLDRVGAQLQQSNTMRKLYAQDKSATENYQQGSPMLKAQYHLIISELYPDDFELILEQQLYLDKLRKEISNL